MASPPERATESARGPGRGSREPLLRLLLPLALAATSAAQPAAQPAGPSLRMPSLETYSDVLPQQTVRALLQDRSGYLWIGTWDGLVRSNGVDFQVFRRPEGLPNDSVSALLEDREGLLWVGTNEGLATWKDGTFEAFRGNAQLPDLLITSLSGDGSGGLLVGTQSGLGHVVGGRVHVFAGEAGAPRGPVHAMAPLGDRVLLATDAGLLSHGPGGFRDEGGALGAPGESAPAGSPAPTRVRSVLAAPDGTVYAGTDGRGVARRQGSRWSVLGAEAGLPTPNAKFLFLDPSGVLWVGTEGFGVCAVREPEGPSPRAECLGRAEGLTSGVVRSLLVDAEGTLWVGTANGLNAVRHQRFQVLGRRHGLPEENVRNVLESRAGELWLGTDGAGVIRVSGDRAEAFGRSRGLASDLIRSLGEDANGHIWAGTNGAGVSVLDPVTGRIRTFDSRNGLSGDLVLAIHRSRDGSMWLGNDSGLVDVFRNGRFEHRAVLPDEAGRPTPLRTFFIREGRDGATWLGTSRGLFRLEESASQRFSKGLGAREIYSLHEIGRGAALVGAAGGLFLFSGGTFQRVRGREGDWDFTVFEILEDLRSDLWLTSNRGVVHLRREAVEAYAAGASRELVGRTFDEADGLTTRQCNGSTSPAGARGRDGRLYIPTNRGLAIVDPGREEPAVPAPRVVIAGALLDGVRAFDRSELVVEPHVRRVEVLYDAPTFVAARRLLFQFRLEGYDAGWVDAGAVRSASYTSLSPGSYLFHARCGTRERGFPEEGVAIRITVQPRLHQRGWVRVLAGTLLVAAIATLVRHRIRRLALLARELEETVASRTAELSEANGRLLDANARLGAANQELRHLSEERAEFLGIAAHDLKSPLSVVVGYAHLLRQASLAPPESLLVDRIMGACGRMKALIEDLLGESALEQGSVTVTLERLDVVELVQGGLRGHHEAAQAKGQRLELDLPSGPLLAMVDRQILGQILDNLVSNAVKFSPRGKTIHVRVDRRQGRVRLEVRDEGPGLTEQDRERLFKRFARLSARPTGGEGSTGLGLSIVAKLAELLGARITCESEPGKGATFTLELPERPPA